MIKKEMLMKKTVPTSNFTFRSNKPVTGDKLVDFDCPFWGKDGKKYILPYPGNLFHYTNCYSFVMGWRLKGERGKDFIPGFVTERKYNIGRIVELVTSDMEAVGRRVLEVVYDIPLELPEKEGYWIKCLEDPEMDGDVHFQMKDKKSGRWLHKVGWDFAPKVVVRNLELRPKIDSILETIDMFSHDMDRNFAIRMLKSRFPPMIYEGMDLVRSELEAEDNAPYYAFNPLKNSNEFIVYKPLWAMRISE